MYYHRTYCPTCGAPRKHTTSLFTKFIIVLAIFMIAGFISEFHSMRTNHEQQVNSFDQRFDREEQQFQDNLKYMQKRSEEDDAKFDKRWDEADREWHQEANEFKRSWNAQQRRFDNVSKEINSQRKYFLGNQ